MRTGLLITAMLGLLAAGNVHAQPSYPTKPIRLIVPFPPGGGLDVVARLVAPKLTEAFGRTVVVDNRPGGGGTMGVETAVRASADGYTMLLVSSAYATNAALYKLPYDPVSDVSPIALVGTSGSVVALHPSVPVTSIKELIAYDKANAGKLNYGSSGTGGNVHLYTELLNLMAGTKMTHVPYKGAGPAQTDLLGGQIQLGIFNMAAVIPLVKSNRLRGIAVTTAKRSNAAPDIPTVAESVSGYEAVNWSAVLGQKTLPKNIAERWNAELNRIVQLPDLKARMADVGIDPAGGSPERVRDFVKRDIEKWQKVVKTVNIKPEN